MANKVNFKMLQPQVVEIVEKLGKKAPDAPNMKDEDLQKLNEAIDNTIGDIKAELHTTQKALTEVIKVVKGEIARRGISQRVDRQISMFDDTFKLEAK